MTRINLLPPEIREKVGRPHIAPWLILMAAVAVAAIVGGFLYFNAQVAGKEDTLEERKQELADLQKQTRPIEKFEAQQRELRALEDLYSEANAGRVAWAKMLNDLAMYVPEGLATASNPRAPAIWLTRLSIDAEPLEAVAAAPAQPARGATPVQIEGYATPAWLCVQTWLPRASDFKAKGFLDAYPYYYYFRGHPKVAELFVRLQNMQEWDNMWLDSSTQTTISETRLRWVTTEEGERQLEEWTYSDWAIQWRINAQWDPEGAIWHFAAGETSRPAGGEAQ